MTRLAGRIRKARLFTGISQKELANRLGVTRGAVANWESANCVLPATERLQGIAQATEVMFEWLATGRGPSKYQASLDDIPAADMEIVEDPLELRLLRAFRSAPRQQIGRIISGVEAHAAISTARTRKLVMIDAVSDSCPGDSKTSALDSESPEI